MKRLILGFALCLLSIAASAQAANNLNCTGAGAAPNTCHAVSDASPVPVVTCNVYKASTLFASGPTVANACNTTLPAMPKGAYTITATFVDSLGTESPQSAPYAFNSLQPLLPPANVRVTSP